MSRGPGRTQMAVLTALRLGQLGHGTLLGDDGAVWHSMSGIATDLRLGEPTLERATIRRAVRSLEDAGLVDVRRERIVVDTETGRQRGHAQNLVRLSARGREYVTERGAR